MPAVRQVFWLVHGITFAREALRALRASEIRQWLNRKVDLAAQGK
jgi:hypothetical protein